MSTSVSFDRTTLSLSPLVVGTDPTATYFLPKDGIARPGFTMRRSYAPDGDVPGKQLLEAVPEQAQVQLNIYVQAADSAALQTAMDALTTATTQWSYDLTVTIDGVANIYQADPEFPQWGEVNDALVRAFMARASITVPVNPS